MHESDMEGLKQQPVNTQCRIKVIICVDKLPGWPAILTGQ